MKIETCTGRGGIQSIKIDGKIIVGKAAENIIAILERIAAAHDEDGWHPWLGIGLQPLLNDEPVEVRKLNGERLIGHAGDFFWPWSNCSGDIVAWQRTPTDWIHHDGSEDCPLLSRIAVEVKLHGERNTRKLQFAGDVNWIYVDCYRILPKQETPAQKYAASGDDWIQPGFGPGDALD